MSCKFFTVNMKHENDCNNQVTLLLIFEHIQVPCKICCVQDGSSSVRSYQALDCMCADCVLACAFVIVRVSSVRFRQCLSAGIVGLTVLSRQKVIHTAENCFPGWKNSHQPDCPDLIEALRPWNYHSNYSKNGKTA